MIQLYINDTQAEIDSNVNISLTLQFEDLNNPTVVKNSFSKTVKLPSTKVNDDLFNHIYQIDHSIFEFDPSQRVPFYLLWNGSVIESGYIKLNSIEYMGRYPQYYNITMYGGLGEFFYTLSEKNMNELKVTSMFYDHTINAQAVKDSFNQSHYSYALTYSGLYDNFDSDKVYNDITNDLTYGVSNVIFRDGKFIVMTQENVITWNPDDGLKIYPVNFYLSLSSSRLRIIYDFIENRLIAFAVGERSIYFTSDLAEFKEWSRINVLSDSQTIVDLSIVDSVFSSYALMDNLSRIFTGNDLGSLEHKGTLPGGAGLNARLKRYRVEGIDPEIVFGFASGLDGEAGTSLYCYQFFQQNGTFGFGGVSIAYQSANPQISSEIVIQNDKNIYDPDTQVYPYHFIATWNSLVYRDIHDPTSALPSFTVYVPPVQFRYNNIERLGISNSAAIASGSEYRTHINVNNSENPPIFYNSQQTGFDILSTQFGVINETGYYFSTYREPGTTIIKLAYGITSNPNTLIPITEYYYETDQGQNLNEYQRDEYRSYYQRPMLKLENLITYILQDSGYGYSIVDPFFLSTNPYWKQTWVIMNRIQYEGQPPEDHVGNIRSGDEVTFKMMIGSSVTQYEFFISFIKMFGLIVYKDPVRKFIYIKSRSAFFKGFFDMPGYTIDDWTEKTDYHKTKTVTPIPFDFKYGIFKYEDAGSYYEELYNEQFLIPYASTRVDTLYSFNNNEKVFFDSIFQNVVMSMEYDRLFAGRNQDYLYADNKVLPALFTKSGNELNYNDSSFHLVFRDGNITLNKDIRITDDSSLMLELGLYMWNDSDTSAVITNRIPNIFRTGIFNGNYYSLDFSKPSELYYPATDDDYPENSTIYYRYWQNWIRERYNKDNKILKCGFYLNEIDFNQFTFNKFIQIHDTLWHVNKIDGFNVGKDQSTSVELLRVDNIDNYTD